MTSSERSGRRRVVVTGIGVVSSIGIGRQAFSRSLREGRCVVTPIRSFDTAGYPYAHATEVQDLGPLQEDYDTLIRDMGRSSAFTVLASREAVADGGLSAVELDRARAGVVFGSTNGESQVIDAIVRRAMQAGPEDVPNEQWSRWCAHRMAESVAADLQLPGSTMVLGTACAGSNFAIGSACDTIQDDEAEVMLCGGVDAVWRAVYSAFFYISAHGTGTRTNDVTEVGAIRDVFGSQLPPISSIKSMLGHTMGAANAMGALACFLGMDEGFMPPTVNFQTPDPECDIDCVPNV